MPEFVRGPLSHALESLIIYGRVLVLDEKLRGYDGQFAPCIVTCPSKPDGSGLWATELGVILHSTELPYVTRVYPFTHCPAAGEHIRFADLIEWALDGIGLLADGTMPVLVVDARYLNTSGYEIIKRYDFKFLACINPVWFPNLRALVMDEVRLPGEWAAVVHRERGELLVHYHSPISRIGKRYIFTNAFIEDSRRLPNGTCPCWDTYQVLFNVLDKFNARMAGHYWPYRRSDWEMAFHDLVLTIVCVDIYHMYLEVHPTEPMRTLGSVMEELAVELCKYAASLRHGAAAPHRRSSTGT